MSATDGLSNTLAEPPGLEPAIGELPTGLRLLCVGSVEPSWVSLTLQLDALGCVEPNFNWASTADEAPPKNVTSGSDPACGVSDRLRLPVEFDDYYQELLRTYVIMGSGNLVAEIVKLADLLSLAGLTPREVLNLHLARVERLVRGLGNRSTRHVMARADLLALELMIHLGECYQRQLKV